MPGPSPPPTPAIMIPKQSPHHEIPQPTVRLSTRRGSMAAPDPWSLNQQQQQQQQQQHQSGPYQQQSSDASHSAGGISFPSSSASRITIVRVPDGAASPQPEDQPNFGVGVGPGPGPGGSSRPGRSNSWGSNYSNNSNTSAPAHPRNASPGGSTRRAGGMFHFVQYHLFTRSSSDRLLIVHNSIYRTHELCVLLVYAYQPSSTRQSPVSCSYHTFLEGVGHGKFYA